MICNTTLTKMYGVLSDSKSDLRLKHIVPTYSCKVYAVNKMSQRLDGHVARREVLSEYATKDKRMRIGFMFSMWETDMILQRHMQPTILCVCRRLSAQHGPTF